MADPAPETALEILAEEEGLLLPYQLRWLRDSATVAIACKSRQIGLTWTTALWAVLQASFDGVAVYVALHSEEPRKEWMRDVTAWSDAIGVLMTSPQDELVNDRAGDYQVTRVRYASGGSIVAVPAIERAIRGRRGHVVIDEAAYAENLGALLNACMPLQMWGYWLRVICTQPRPGAASWRDWHDMLARVDEAGWSLHTVTLADAMREGLFGRVAARLGVTPTAEAAREWEAQLRRDIGPVAAQELDCVPGQSEGAYIPESVVRARSVPCPVERWAWTDRDALTPEQQAAERVTEWLESRIAPHIPDLPDPRQRWLGWDVAQDPGGDPVVGIVLEEDPGDRDRLAPMLVVEFRGLPDERQRQVIDWLWHRMELTGLAIDATGVGQAIGRWARRTWPTRARAVAINRSWYASELPEYRDALERGVQSVPAHPDIVADHSVVIAQDGHPKVGPHRTVGMDGQQRHGDSVIALLMARHARGRRRRAGVATFRLGGSG